MTSENGAGRTSSAVALGLCVMILGQGCAATCKRVKILDVIDFRHVLLRDAVAELSETSGVRIELTEQLGHVLDLAIDHTSKDAELGDIMDDICLYIERQYGLKCIWECDGERTIVMELSKGQGEVVHAVAKDVVGGPKGRAPK